MEKLIKKIKNISLLLGILLCIGVIFPFSTSAQTAKTLTVTAPGAGAFLGQNYPIKVTTSDGKANIVVKFQSADPSVSLSVSECKTVAGGSCSIYFKSSVSGSYTLGISAVGYEPIVTAPIVVAGNGIQVSANPSKVTPNQNSTITVRLSDLKKNVSITFPGLQSSVISPQTCTTNTSGYCTITFNQTNAFSLGDFTVVARAPGYSDGSSVITVVRSLTPTPATPTSPSTPPVGSPVTPCTNDSNCYKLLAPITSEMGDTFDPTPNDALGNYINILIKIFIGICAVLAMVMIVAGGLEYMTAIVPSNKEDGKHRIKEAILGLLLALGSYMILNTLNPDLLKLDPKIEQATLMVLGEEVETAPPSPSTFTTTPPSNAKTGICPEGITRITTSAGAFAVCGKVASSLTSLINTAWSQGYKIYGGALRSNSQQISLRIANCGGNTQYNIYQKPASSCTPPTAIPGTSRHENGLAVDMTCDGTSIQATDNRCFLWLKANAGKYGFYNLPSEPWHWSVDGK